MAQDKRKPISLSSADSQQAGLLDDADVVVQDAEWCEWDYNGKAAQAVAAAHLTIVADGTDEPVDLYLSAGGLGRVCPNEDGEQLVPAEGSSATGLAKGCNASIFFASLENCGFPMAKVAERISVLKGLGFHLLRVKAPARVGLAREEGDQKREQTIPTVQKINHMPGEGKGSKAGAKSKASSSAGDESHDWDSDVQAAVAELIGEDGLAKGKLMTKIFQKFSKHDDKSAIVKAVQSEEYLAGIGFAVVDGIVVAG